MTVYSGVLGGSLRQIRSRSGRSLEGHKLKLGKHQEISAGIAHASVFRLNVVLLLIAAITIAAYIFISNLLVAQRYALNLHKSELSQLNAGLAAKDQSDGSEDLGTLLRFAQNAGLVEAKDIDSILEKDGFAILP